MIIYIYIYIYINSVAGLYAYGLQLDKLGPTLPFGQLGGRLMAPSGIWSQNFN